MGSRLFCSPGTCCGDRRSQPLGGMAKSFLGAREKKRRLAIERKSNRVRCASLGMLWDNRNTKTQKSDRFLYTGKYFLYTGDSQRGTSLVRESTQKDREVGRNMQKHP